ncbi:MAG: hypothetical protein GXO75_02275 [Calditrichaeota bacterium]|nr:hypothetical protein [Actinomycetota bacterium]NOY57746.1 hypothetical protein [Calditrichota bacterium]
MARNSDIKLRVTVITQTAAKVMHLVFSYLLVTSCLLYAQETQKKSEYLLGTAEALEMVVHVWGDVRNPGEYRVPYDTNLLELISKAGGPAQYANLSKIRLTHESKSWHLTKDGLKKIISESRAGKITEDKLEESLKSHFANRVLVFNLDNYLKTSETLSPPPVLKPGDVVFVPRNSWSKWREFVRVANEVAVITSIYVWYLRAK